MAKRIAILGIIVENTASVEKLNGILHEYGGCILGRMGIPLREQSVNLISIALCAKNDEISALSGKIGRLEGVQAKVTYSNVNVE